MSHTLNISLRSGKKVNRKSEESGDHNPSDNPDEEEFSSDEDNNTNCPTPDSQKSSEGNISEAFSTPNLEKEVKPVIDMAPSTFNTSHAIKLIPEFDGSPSTLTRFVQIAKIHYAKASDDIERAEFLDIIKSKLIGRAYNALLRYNHYNNWTELLTAINKQFSKFRSTQVIQAELFNVKQGTNETVSHYAERIEKLLEELNISSTQGENDEGSKAIRGLNEKTALNNFKRGLRAPLKLIVKSTKHESLASAVDYAVEEEHIAQSDTKAWDIKRCNFCKISGHTANECRKLQDTPQSRFETKTYSNRLPQFNNPQRINNIQGVPVCRYCKISGHTIQECRKRQYNNARRDNLNSNNTTMENTAPNRGQSRSAIGNSRQTNPGNSATPGTSGTMVRVRSLE